MEHYKAEPVVKLENELGEGPVWHPHDDLLYWVDIKKGLLYSYNPLTGDCKNIFIEKGISAVVPVAPEQLIAALPNEIVELDCNTGEKRKILNIESHIEDNRCNDGKCDVKGRFWIGTMHQEAAPDCGSLYRLENGTSLTKMLSDLTISNGLGWSPDNTKMYFIDSSDRQVKCFDFNVDAGEIKNGKIIIKFNNPDELPDGMCVDEEGMLWIAFWGGARVGKYHPKTGEHLADIEVPAPNVTSCTFGGDDYQALFITSARDGLTENEEQYPFSGSLFSCRMPVKGQKAFSFLKNTTLS
jgi:sugar lactone lactonase YvrE